MRRADRILEVSDEVKAERKIRRQEVKAYVKVMKKKLKEKYKQNFSITLVSSEANMDPFIRVRDPDTLPEIFRKDFHTKVHGRKEFKPGNTWSYGNNMPHAITGFYSEWKKFLGDS